MSDQPVAETSTWQHTSLTRDRHWCPWQDFNLEYQQASGRRHALDHTTTKTGKQGVYCCKICVPSAEWLPETKPTFCVQEPARSGQTGENHFVGPCDLLFAQMKVPWRRWRSENTGRDSTWTTGVAGQHHETGGPEILPGVGEAFTPAYKL
jgi:hypothetical protein